MLKSVFYHGVKLKMIDSIISSDIEKLDEKILVYNIEVVDFNTYFVGDMTFLVHNYDKKRIITKK